MELMPSILILSLLMAAVLGFLAQVQKRFQGQQVNAESSQGARGAIEILTQEIGQAAISRPPRESVRFPWKPGKSLREPRG